MALSSSAQILHDHVGNCRTSPMPLTPFLEGTAFGPDEIAVMVGLRRRPARDGLDRPHGPAAVTLARSIVVLAKNGERDPVRLRERAVELLYGLPPDAAAAD
jgi:hypothetical protein